MLKTFILGLVFLANLHAQKFPFTIIGLKEGLPQLTVYHVVQDKQGYIWFLTESSICRYDGYKFLNYSFRSGWESEFLTGVQLDYDGRVCICMVNKGIAYLDNGKFHWITKPMGLPSDKINSMALTGFGELVMATADAGVVMIAANKPIRTLYPHHPTDVTRVRRIFVQQNGDVITTCNEGVIKFAKENNYRNEIIYPGISNIHSCFETNRGDIWIGGDRILIRVKGKRIIDETGLLRTLDGEPTNVWHMFKPKDASKLIFSTSKGLLVINDSTGTWLTMDNGLPYNDICGTYEDRFGNFWVATYAGGVAILDNKGFDHFDYSEEKFPLYPVSVASDKDARTWMGSNYAQSLFYFENNGVKHFADNRLDGNQNLIAALEYNSVTDEIWIGGTHGRLIKIKNKKIIFCKDYDHSISHINILPDGTGVVCTRDGAFLQENGSEVLEVIPQLPVTYYRSSFTDKDNCTWFLGGEGEVFKWKDEKVEDVQSTINPNGGTMVCGLYDEKHNLWWFCSKTGLIVWNGDKRIVMNSSNVLHNDFPWAIEQDQKNRIWIGHKKGIECIDPDSKNVSFFGFNEGFTPVEVNGDAISRDINGDLWIGTIRSATRIRMNDLDADNRKGVLRIQKISGGKRTVYLESYQDTGCPPVSFHYNENLIAIQMAGLFYSNTKNVRYYWYLEGYDAEWTINNENREALYVDVPPGNYQFHAFATGPNGYKTREVIVSIHISRPFWKRPWFYIIEFSILACFVFFSFRFSSDPNKTKLGNFMTLLTILIVFESMLIWIGTYVNKFTNDIPVFQLVMNVIFAATLHPLENGIRKFMRRWAIKKARKKAVNTNSSE